MLGACAIFGACGDQPEPQHPHAHHSKHKKHTKDDSDEVAVTDDGDNDVATKSDDADTRDVAKSKTSTRSKRHDTDDVAQDDDATKTKHSKRHETAEAKQDDDESKPKHSKQHDTDEAKQGDEHDDESKPKHSKAHDTDNAKQDDDDSKPKHSKAHDTDEAKSDDDESKPKHSKLHDTDEAKSDDDKPKHSKAHDTDEAKSDDDESKPKHSKLHDTDEAKSDDDKPRHSKAHGIDEAKQDDDEAKPKHLKSHDTDEAKQHDAKRDDAKKDDAKKDEDEAKATKPTHRTSKGKRVVAQRAAKAKGKDDAAVDNNEIEMGEGDEDSAAESSTPDAGNAVAVVVPAPAPASSPLAINDRALIARHGKLDVHGGLRTTVLTLPTATAGMTTTNTAEALALGATYGIGAKAEVGLDYTASLSPGAIKGPLTLHGAYLAVAGPKLDVAVAAALAVDFLDFTDAMGATTSKAAYALQLGGWVRYRVTPKAALFTGLPALPAETASLSKQAFALPPLPYQLAVGLSSGSAIALDLPVGLGYQVTPAVYAFAMTDLAHLRISNTQTALLFADFIPLTVGGFYSRDKLDLGATLADDLKQGTGYLRFEVVVRYAIP